MTDSLPPEIDVATLAQLRAGNSDHVLLDVREDWEHDLCAIDGALHIPMTQLVERLTEVPKDQALVVMCHLGGRSAQVAAWLRQQGWDQVTDLAGGIDAWSKQIDDSMATY